MFLKRNKKEFKINLYGLKVKAKKLTTADFIECGFSLNFFDQTNKKVGQFHQFEKLMNETNDKITKEQIYILNAFLKLSIKDFSDSWLKQKIKKAYGLNDENSVIAVKILLFNCIIAKSSTRFFESVNVNKDLVLLCHFLSKEYGNTPWYYLNMSIDEFMFCSHCLISGKQEEKRING